MIDIAALKMTARRNMSGRTPSVFLTAVLYVAIFTLLAALIGGLSGWDKLFLYIERIAPLITYPTFGELEAAMPVIQPAAALLILAILIVRLLLSVGYRGYCLKISRNEDAGPGAFFDGFSLALKIIALWVMRFCLTALWSLALLVPGIAAFYSYRQAYYILLDSPELSPAECLRRSRQLMAGHKLDLFFLDFSFLGWFLLDQMVRLYAVLPVVSVWLSPFSGVTRAGFYNLLAGVTVSEGDAE